MQNKKLLVTGSSSGIGLALCKYALAKGAHVIGADRQPAAIDAANYRHEMFDQADQASIRNLADRLRANGIMLDGLALHAGVIPRPCGIEDITDEALNTVIDINLKGTFYGLKYLGAFVRPNGGAICVTSSVDGVIGEPYAVMYSATKAAVLSLTKSFARYYGKTGIRVNAVAPGLIDTPLTHSAGEDPANTTEVSIIKRMGTADEIANAIYFLLSDDSSYITGQNLIVDGGFVLK